jgi:Holliday junction resolvase RusA-like endonuclease
MKINENAILYSDICKKFDIETIKYVFDIEPFHAPRMVKSDKWAKRDCVVKYFNFRNKLYSLALQQQYEIKGILNIIFVIPFPESWSEKKKKENYLQPVTVKPDIDNLIKAFMDSLLKNDSYVWGVTAKKIYATFGKIIIF